MHSSKISNFVQSHSGTSFPQFRSLTADECIEIRRILSQRIGSSDHDGLTLLKALESSGELVPDSNAESPSFNLRAVLLGEEIVPGKLVYLNWYRLDEIDEIQFDDVSQFFDDIWYPGSDDLEVLDRNLNWILFVHHTGNLKIARLL
jgi:hypothetical protein